MANQIFNPARPSDRRLLNKAVAAIDKYFGNSAGPMRPVVRVYEVRQPEKKGTKS